VTEALSVIDQPVFRSREGPLRAWLGGELARFAADLAQPAATQFLATVIGTADQVQAVADLRGDLLRRISAVLGSGLAEAAATGELGQRLDPAARPGDLPREHSAGGDRPRLHRPAGRRGARHTGGMITAETVPVPSTA
jgi:hypothetical protein